MRDLNRKVEKFIKSKEVASATTRASPLTPHVVYGVSSSPKTIAKINNNLSTRSFSMTVSFFNPRFEKNPQPKEICIRHEDKKIAQLTASPDRNKSPSKRDPILQNNNETIEERKSCVKWTPLSARTTIFSEEPVYSKKINGEFNHVYQARSQSPKIESIRTSIPKRSDSPDLPRRSKKFVTNSHMFKPNPITEGDPAGVVIRKERNVPEISEETKRINDRKYVLQADREGAPKNKPHRASSVTFGADISSEASRPDSRSDRFLGARLGSPKLKPEDSISGVLEYQSAWSYRDQRVADKCTNVPVSTLIRAAEV